MLNFVSIFLCLLLSPIAYGQIITAAFDRTNLSINPAASTTRSYSQIAFFNNYRKTDSEALQVQGGIAKLKEGIRTNKTGIYYSGEGRFAPELYLSKDSGTKTFDDGTTTNQTSKMDLVNNFINLGFKLWRNLSVGLKYYRPSYEMNEKAKFGTFSVNNKSKTSITGMGAGFNYQMQNKMYFGGYYTKITQKNELSVSTNSGGTAADDFANETHDLSQYGLGFSILRGTVAKGYRFEAAYSRLEQPKDSVAKAGEEIYLVFEYGHRHVAFGGNVRFRKNAYYDNTEILDYAIGEKIFSDSYDPSLGGFFSLQSSGGHTLGLSGVLYKTTGKRQFYGVTQDAEMKVMQLTVNYAYLF